MNAIELAKAFDPKSYEDRIHRFWMEHGLFTPRPNGGGRTYVIVIPPPNVTGVLHIGHALNDTLQDILVRWRRMQGRSARWVAGGTDLAVQLAGGDVATGGATVILAMGAGKAAARDLHRSLCGDGQIDQSAG